MCELMAADCFSQELCWGQAWGREEHLLHTRNFNPVKVGLGVGSEHSTFNAPGPQCWEESLTVVSLDKRLQGQLWIEIPLPFLSCPAEFGKASNVGHRGRDQLTTQGDGSTSSRWANPNAASCSDCGRKGPARTLSSLGKSC